MSLKFIIVLLAGIGIGVGLYRYFIDKPKEALKFSILFAYLLMVMGTLVTSTDSGLGCPDWPLCYGTVAPPLDLQTWIEWTHRILGYITSVLIFTSAMAIKNTRTGVEKTLIFTTLGLLACGVLLGGLIVHVEAPLLETFTHTLIISTHLIFATLIISCLIFTYRILATNGTEPDTKYFGLLFPLVYLQIIIGILVRYSKGTLACPDFPLCNGSLIPDFAHFTITLHFTHRVIAAIILITIVTLLIKTIRDGYNAKGLITILILVLTQASIGVTIVVTGAFFPALILHGAVGFLILAFMAYKAMPFYFKERS